MMVTGIHGFKRRLDRFMEEEGSWNGLVLRQQRLMFPYAASMAWAKAATFTPCLDPFPSDSSLGHCIM